MMYVKRWWMLAIVITAVAAAGCAEEPTRWDNVQEETRRNADAVATDAVKGGALNRFFPKVESPWDIVFNQEKTGFAQASLQEKGTEMATLSISDTRNNPEATDKFKESTETIESFPMAAAGGKGTAVLVADRYQVQIRSVDPSLGEEERKQWLAKFDLKSLANL